MRTPCRPGQRVAPANRPSPLRARPTTQSRRGHTRQGDARMSSWPQGVQGKAHGRPIGRGGVEDEQRRMARRLRLAAKEEKGMCEPKPPSEACGDHGRTGQGGERGCVGRVGWGRGERTSSGDGERNASVQTRSCCQLGTGQHGGIVVPAAEASVGHGNECSRRIATAFALGARASAAEDGARQIQVEHRRARYDLPESQLVASEA
eukprot:1660368-Pleurochrysis_carterae.AAC.3